MRKLRIDWARFRGIAAVPTSSEPAEQPAGIAAANEAP